MKRVAGETRSQEARKIRNEAIRIDRRLRIMLETEKVELRKVLEVASPDLQDVIFEKFYSGFKEWKEILESLARNEESEERNTIEREKMCEEVIEKVMVEFREQQKAERVREYRERKMARGRTRCFICQSFGHYARECRF
ncbi:hypothetical protein NGRA_3084, partial [Nosema granulosis]